MAICKLTLDERFWAKVQKTDTCWLWTARLNPDGYGSFRGITAHRYSWLLHRGPIPQGLLVCHRCDVPACVNPSHLFVGTQRENMRDCRSKGRYHKQLFAKGNRPLNTTKLTLDQVQSIRRISRGAEVSRKELAHRFGVSQNTIRDVVSGRTWMS